MTDDATTDEAEITRQATLVVREASEEADSLLEPTVNPEETKETRTPGFSRMRIEWNPHDIPVLESLRTVVDDLTLKRFLGAYQIMNEIYELVREPETDEHGAVVHDRFGFVVWKRKPDGGYIEDYGQVSERDREDLLFKITTNLFEWKQESADLWGDAMFAKAMWEESMAIGFIEASGKTIDAKTQEGRLNSRDERYHAIFRTLISRRADAIVSTLELIGLRLSQRLS
jgi:hypothetical protein